jgi:hypothetical protein
VQFKKPQSTLCDRLDHFWISGNLPAPGHRQIPAEQSACCLAKGRKIDRQIIVVGIGALLE